jgi:hypothetical protein
MGGLLTLFSGGGRCREDRHACYEGLGKCEAEMLKRMPILRYLKDPVVHIEELDAHYPYGGQAGWYALVISAGQFAYWDALYNRWSYMKYPPVTSEALLAGLGINPESLSDGAQLKWNAEAGRLELRPPSGNTVDTNQGKIDLRSRYVRRIGHVGLSFAGHNISPAITPASGHVCTVWFKSLEGGTVTFPSSSEETFDGKTWVCFDGTSVPVGGGKWAEVTVTYTGQEYMARCFSY